MKMKTGFRRLMSMLMCFVMVAGMVPASALATETSPAEIPTAVVESAAPEVPAADALVIEEPVGEAPAEEPADETPAEEPADETPAEEPADETPAEEPADETPAEEPADETPAEEPADETPAEESPAEEPVVEAAAEEPAEEDTVEEAAEEAETEEANPVQELFDTLMAFETYEALGDYMDNMTEEQYELLAQFTEEQNAALREKIAALQENEVEILDHTFNHLDVRIQNVPLTLTKKVINMVTGVTVSTSTSEITANLTKVEYVTINGVTYSNFNKMDRREWRQSNVAINLSALTESSTAVLVVDLVDTNGNTYDDVRITYNRAGIQYAIEHCDGYRNGQYDGIDFDPAQGANNITLVEYDDYVIPVMKIWEDDNDRDRIRPASVTVNLYANGVLNDSVVLSDDNGWQHTFTGKPSHDDAGNSIAYTIDEEDVSDVYTKTVGNNGTHLTVTNSYTPETVDITANKVWEDNDDSLGKRPASVSFQLYGNGSAVGEPVELNEAGGWTHTWTGLPKNSAGTEINYTVGETSAPEGYEHSVSGYTITNKYVDNDPFNQMYGRVTITGQKIWDDNGDETGRPDSITVHLLADGKKVATQTVTGPNWTWSFDISNGIPGTGESPVGVEFTVEEDTVLNYVLSDTKNPIVVFNDPSAGAGWRETKPCSSLAISSAQDAKSIVVAKKGNDYVCWSWDALASFERALIVESVAAATGFSSDISNYTFISGVGNQSEFGMTVTETEVQFGKTSQWSWFAHGTYNRGSADSTASSLTNSLSNLTISGTKVWEDANNQDGIRPETVTINLLANGEKIDSVAVAEGTWEFTGLKEYQNGEKIEYTITENAVDGYTSEITGDAETGFTVTNTHTPEQTEVSVTKVWEDNDDQDGFRPDSITINLLANGEEAGSVELNKDNQWKHTFTELDKYAEGVEITYTVQEVEVDEYTTEITGDAATGFTVTNTHTPVEMKINGNKYWEDGNNQDGIRPASITIRLFANGTEVDSRTVTEEDEWKWSFEELPKFSEGEEIVYTIVEDAVDGYESRVEGFDVINTHVPAEIDITVVKAWADDKNEGETRPEKVTILLYANGEDTGKRLVLTENSGWVGRFYDLPVYADGEPIEYTIDEAAVEGYNAVIRGSAESGFTVTNSLKDIPSTGDERTPMLWIGLMLASMLSFAWAVLPVGKKRRQ